VTHAVWSSSAQAKPSLRVLRLVAFGWFAGFLAAAVLLSLVAEVGSALAVWCAVAGLCGAVAHVGLLLSPRFRALRANRLGVLWLAAMSLIVGWSAVYLLLMPSEGSGSGIFAELISTALYAAIPVLFASFAASWFAERAGA
jgi:hypothetical protein